MENQKIMILTLFLILLSASVFASPNIVAGQVTYETSDKNIIVTIPLENKGDDMNVSNIIEMQPRPDGFLPLALVSLQKTCDATTPYNVHKEYKLAKGETVNIYMTTTMSDYGIYDVFLMTRTGCWKDTEGVNDRVNPFPNSFQIPNVKLEAQQTTPAVPAKVAPTGFLDEYGISGLQAVLILLIIVGIIGFIFSRGGRKR